MHETGVVYFINIEILKADYMLGKKIAEDFLDA